ncbi:MAG TPA: alpha/beta fold hydrolase [Candidatus Baltobacteraceae bacterium]|nr:alpha/beta fold hydrolase [Candidatus Baltobacteraceae bacterium]
MKVYGTPNARRDNLVLVCHALTGTSAVADWWPALLAPNALFDTNEYCVIGVDITGGTLSDVVRAQRETLTQHGFDRFRVVIGGSLGGMQVLQWALDAPERIDHAIVVGAHDHQSAMGIAFNAVQREAIALDSARGLGLARKIAMLTYKSEELLNERHDRRPDRNDPSRFDIEGYLDLQAQRFIDRFDAATYVARTHLMDSFDVRHRAGEPTPELTFVGICSDWLYRPQDVRAAAARFNARYLELESTHGHDAFLAEPEKLNVTLNHVSP